ncbi:MAG: IPExxxVDY family protein [Bacteroidota bacterium]
MSKIVRHTLAFENDYDYELIGICSHVSDYKLVWNINESLNFQLEKASNLFMVNTKKGTLASSHPYYFMNDEERRIEIYLIKNKHEGKFLIPEKQQIDYFLFVCNNMLHDLDMWLEKLKTIDCIMAAFSFQAQEFSSTQQIVFE